ncbi:hypothetical protein [Agrobacterium tumefaciens]|uniref:hypothetical protein n=1 Tax=Agrobacterium tumefaciens TaxID=358 RepID=UPI002FDBE590
MEEFEKRMQSHPMQPAPVMSDNALLSSDAIRPILATLVEELTDGIAIAQRLGANSPLLQRKMLREMGCPVGQGYLFGRPIDAEVFAAGLARIGSDGVETV